MVIYTREEYMAASREDGPAAHRRYYAQFVSQATVSAVVSQIGAKAIMASAYPHFNDIPLHRWDALAITLARPMKAAGDYLTLAGKVCIAKEAARQYAEKHKAAD